MADNSQRCRKTVFEGLSLPKESIFPSITSPWLLEEPIINHDVSDQMELKAYPTAILDDSCIAEVMSKPSIPLVESVEAFALGHIESPIGSVKPNVDLPINKCEGNAKSIVTFPFKEQSHVNGRS